MVSNKTENLNIRLKIRSLNEIKKMKTESIEADINKALVGSRTLEVNRYHTESESETIPSPRIAALELENRTLIKAKPTNIPRSKRVRLEKALPSRKNGATTENTNRENPPQAFGCPAVPKTLFAENVLSTSRSTWCSLLP